MAKDNLVIYNDGVCRRLLNRRVGVVEYGEDIKMVFHKIDHDIENHHKASCETRIERGKVRVTELALSYEAMDALVSAYVTFKKHKLNASKP